MNKNIRKKLLVATLIGTLAVSGVGGTKFNYPVYATELTEEEVQGLEREDKYFMLTIKDYTDYRSNPTHTEKEWPKFEFHITNTLEDKSHHTIAREEIVLSADDFDWQGANTYLVKKPVKVFKHDEERERRAFSSVYVLLSDTEGNKDLIVGDISDVFDARLLRNGLNIEARNTLISILTFNRNFEKVKIDYERDIKKEDLEKIRNNILKVNRTGNYSIYVSVNQDGAKTTRDGRVKPIFVPIDDLITRVKDSETSTDLTMEDLANMEKDKKTKEDEINNLNEKIQELEKAKSDNETKISELEKNLTDKNKESETLLEEKQKLEKELGEKNREIEELKSELEKLKSSNGDKDSEIKKLHDEVSRLDSENILLKGKLEILKEKLEKEKQKNEQNTELIKSLEDKIKELEDSIKVKDQEIANKNEEISKLNSSLSDKDSKIQELEDKLKEKESEKNSCCANISEIEKKLEELKNSTSEKDKELENKINELKSSLDKTNEELNKLKEDVENKQKEIDEINEKLEENKDKEDKKATVDASTQTDVTRDIAVKEDGSVDIDLAKKIEEYLRKKEEKEEKEKKEKNNIEKDTDKLEITDIVSGTKEINGKIKDRYLIEIYKDNKLIGKDKSDSNGYFNVELDKTLEKNENITIIARNLDNNSKKELNIKVKENSKDKNQDVNKDILKRKNIGEFAVFQLDKNYYNIIKDNNKKTVYMDVKVYAENGRTMIPIRYIAYTLGFNVEYDKNTREAIFSNRDNLVMHKRTLRLNIDTGVMKDSDGRVFYSDVKPVIKNGRVFASISNIAKAFGLTHGDINDNVDQTIEWDQNNKAVYVFKNIK